MKRTILLLLSVFTCATFASGQIVTWNFENTTDATSVADGIYASSVSISSGSFRFQSGEGGMIGYGSHWSRSSDLDKYLEFSVSADAGYSFDISSFSLQLGRTGSGPQNFTLQYSFDGFSSSVFTIGSGSITSTNSNSLDSFNLSGNLPIDSVTGTITFRLYGHDASSTGNLRVNDFEIFGSITSLSAIPEPSTYTAIIGIFSLGFLLWRRRVKP